MQLIAKSLIKQDTLLQYIRTPHRIYDPGIGRFTAVDALASQSAEITPYHFAMNNPVNANDPSGLYTSWYTSYMEHYMQGVRMRSLFDDEDYSNWEKAMNRMRGPGSGNYWSDQYRSVAGNMALMSTGTFRSFYGIDQMSDEQVTNFALNNDLASSDPEDIAAVTGWNPNYTYAYNPYGGEMVKQEFYYKNGVRHRDDYYEGEWYLAKTVQNYLSQQQPIMVDNTWDARSHYINGDGSAVRVGPNTINALLNNEGFLRRHKRILSGSTTSLVGNFSVNMTNEAFWIGRTNVNYSISCNDGNCNVRYELFANDGFWDINFVDEKVLGDWLNIESQKPDGLGPNLEDGTPYPFIIVRRNYYFKNPGY